MNAGVGRLRAMWIGLGVILAILGGVAILMWLGSKERKVTEAELAAVRSLSSADAEALALDLLKRPDLFETEPAVALPLPHDLPEHVQALFAQYASIRRGEFILSINSLAQEALLPGFFKVGEDFEFTEILVRSNDNRVYVSYGEGPRSEKTLEPEETIWHEIIMASGIKVGAQPGAPGDVTEEALHFRRRA